MCCIVCGFCCVASNAFGLFCMLAGEAYVLYGRNGGGFAQTVHVGDLTAVKQNTKHNKVVFG